MGPKIRAAIEFVEKTGKEVLITDAEHLKDALARDLGHVHRARRRRQGGVRCSAARGRGTRT